MQTTEAEVLPEIVRRLVAEFNPKEIILFGSRAWGQPQTDSDYDLMVILAENQGNPARLGFRAHDCLSGLGIAKDVIVSTREDFDRFSGVKASLEAKILNQGVVIYGRSQRSTGSELAPQGVG
jgi:predicted nucleotidyltransferase